MQLCRDGLNGDRMLHRNCLWKTDAKEHKNNNMRDNIWAMVLNECGMKDGTFTEVYIFLCFRKINITDIFINFLKKKCFT